VADGVDDARVCDVGDLRHHVADFWGGGDHFDGGGVGGWWGKVGGAIAVEEVVVGLGCAEDVWFVDAVAVGVDEGAFDVGAEGFGAVLGTVGCGGGAEGGEDLGGGGIALVSCLS
jgi:hypothetical protein